MRKSRLNIMIACLVIVCCLFVFVACDKETPSGDNNAQTGPKVVSLEITDPSTGDLILKENNVIKNIKVRYDENSQISCDINSNVTIKEVYDNGNKNSINDSTDLTNDLDLTTIKVGETKDITFTYKGLTATITARFVLADYSLEISENITGGVIIRNEWKDVSFGGEDELVVQPNTGYVIKEVKVATKGDNGEYGEYVAQDISNIDENGEWKHKFTNITQLMKIDAVFEPITYNITWDLNGGEWADGYVPKTTYSVLDFAESSYFDLPMPSKDDVIKSGYKPKVWTYGETNIEETSSTHTIALDAMKDLTFKLEWETEEYDILLKISKDYVGYAPMFDGYYTFEDGNFWSFNLKATFNGDIKHTTVLDSKPVESYDITLSTHTLLGWYANDVMIISPNGEVSKGVEGYTNQEGKWIRTQKTELIAKFDAKIFKFNVDLNKNLVDSENPFASSEPSFVNQVNYDSTKEYQTFYIKYLTSEIYDNALCEGNPVNLKAQRDGYTFEGFYKCDGSSCNYYDLLITTEGNLYNKGVYEVLSPNGEWIYTNTENPLLLRAKWNVNNISINLNTTEGTGSTKVTWDERDSYAIKYDSNVLTGCENADENTRNKLGWISRVGYNFLGLFDDNGVMVFAPDQTQTYGPDDYDAKLIQVEGYSKNTNQGIIWTRTEPCTLTAKWEAQVYKVTFNSCLVKHNHVIPIEYKYEFENDSTHTKHILPVIETTNPTNIGDKNYTISEAYVHFDDNGLYLNKDLSNGKIKISAYIKAIKYLGLKYRGGLLFDPNGNIQANLSYMDNIDGSHHAITDANGNWIYKKYTNETEFSFEVAEEDRSYQITYDSNGGVFNNTQEATYVKYLNYYYLNDSILYNDPFNPTFAKEGYEFIGWSTTKDGTVSEGYLPKTPIKGLNGENNGIVLSPDEDYDLTLYAVWVEVVSKIKFKNPDNLDLKVKTVNNGNVIKNSTFELYFYHGENKLYLTANEVKFALSYTEKANPTGIYEVIDRNSIVESITLDSPNYIANGWKDGIKDLIIINKDGHLNSNVEGYTDANGNIINKDEVIVLNLVKVEKSVEVKINNNLGISTNVATLKRVDTKEELAKDSFGDYIVDYMLASNKLVIKDNPEIIIYNSIEYERLGFSFQGLYTRNSDGSSTKIYDRTFSVMTEVNLRELFINEDCSSKNVVLFAEWKYDENTQGTDIFTPRRDQTGNTNLNCVQKDNGFKYFYHNGEWLLFEVPMLDVSTNPTKEITIPNKLANSLYGFVPVDKLINIFNSSLSQYSKIFNLEQYEIIRIEDGVEIGKQAFNFYEEHKRTLILEDSTILQNYSEVDHTQENGSKLLAKIDVLYINNTTTPILSAYAQSLFEEVVGQDKEGYTKYQKII